MRMKTTLAAAVLLALTSMHAAAQPIILEDVVVSANRTPTLAAQTGADVSVVTDTTFQDDGRPFALDYITELPGVTVQQNGPAGTVSGFAVRGAPQQYVRVQIDGIEVSDPTAPQVTPSLSGLLVDDISRIEVLKGSQSALYGGQAVGGVISITTPKAEQDGLESRYLVEGGSYHTLRGRYTLTGRDERGEFALTATRFQTDGFSAAEEDDGNSEKDGYDTTRLSGSGTYYASDTVSIFGSAFWQKEDGDFDTGPGPGGDGPETFDATSWGARAGSDFATLDGRLDNRVAASYYSIDRTQQSAFGPFTTDGTRTQAEYLGKYELSEQLGVQFGTDYTRETSESNYSGGEKSNWIGGVFGQADWSPVEALTLNGALRYDNHSEFGGYTTGRLTAAYVLPSDTILRGSFGTGFRAPSIFELFDAFSGNPGLNPETSISGDIGIEQVFAGGKGRAGATLFYLDIDDLIEYDFAEFRYTQSDGKSESRGLELSAAWAFTETLGVSGAYTYTDAKGPDGGQRDRIPRHDLSVFLDGTFLEEKASFSAGARFVGDYFDDSTAVDSANFKKDFVVFNARAAYAISDAAEVYVRAENLFDEQYQTARGYGTANQSFYFGVSGRF